MSETHKMHLSKPMSDEQKKKISQTLRGTKKSVEMRNKLSESKIGMIWVTNGIVNKFVHKDGVPEGFKRGLTRRKSFV